MEVTYNDGNQIQIKDIILYPNEKIVKELIEFSNKVIDKEVPETNNRFINDKPHILEKDTAVDEYIENTPELQRYLNAGKDKDNK